MAVEPTAFVSPQVRLSGPPRPAPHSGAPLPLSPLLFSLSPPSSPSATSASPSSWPSSLSSSPSSSSSSPSASSLYHSSFAATRRAVSDEREKEGRSLTTVPSPLLSRGLAVRPLPSLLQSPSPHAVARALEALKQRGYDLAGTRLDLNVDITLLAITSDGGKGRNAMSIMMPATATATTTTKATNAVARKEVPTAQGVVLRRLFRKWQSRVAVVHIEAMEHTNALSHHVQFTQRYVLQSWSGVVASWARDSKLLRVAQLWARWKAALRKKKRRNEVAATVSGLCFFLGGEDTSRYLLARFTLKRWLDAARASLRSKVAAKSARLLALRKMWAEWKARAVCKKLQGTAESFKRRVSLECVWAAWTSALVRRRRVEGYTAVRASRLQIGYWRQWKQAWAVSARLNLIEEELIGRTTHHLLMRVIEGWHSVAVLEAQTDTKKYSTFARVRRKQRAWGAWRNATLQARLAREAAQALGVKARTRRALRQWIRATVIWKDEREKLLVAGHHWAMTTTKRSFASLLLNVKMERAQRLANAHRLRRLFNGWNAMVKSEQLREEKMRLAESFQQQSFSDRVLYRVFLGWREYVRATKSERKAVEFAAATEKARLTRRAFGALRHHAVNAIRDKELERNASVFEARRMMSQVWTTWKARTRAANVRALALHHCDKKLTALKARTFLTWQLWASAVALARTKLATHYHETRVLRLVFKAWRLEVKAEAHAQTLLARRVRFLFDAWKVAALDVPLMKGRVAELIYRKRLLERPFKEWRAMTAARTVSQWALAIDFWAISRARRVLLAWRDVARDLAIARELNAQATAFHSFFTQARFFWAWRSWTVKEKSHRAALIRASFFYEERLKAYLFGKWRRKARYEGKKAQVNNIGRLKAAPR